MILTVILVIRKVLEHLSIFGTKWRNQLHAPTKHIIIQYCIFMGGEIVSHRFGKWEKEGNFYFQNVTL